MIEAENKTINQEKNTLFLFIYSMRSEICFDISGLILKYYYVIYIASFFEALNAR